MKNLLLQIFTWWNSQTMGMRFHIWKHGEFVGEDEFGNKYYKDRHGGRQRWVVYNGYAEASTIPPGWHGWIHHRVDTPPTEENYKPRAWEKAHVPNMTGTGAAYRPKGSILSPIPGERQHVTGDYQAWTPGE